MSDPSWAAVRRVIEARKTVKVLGDLKGAWEPTDHQIEVGNQGVMSALMAARWAPFHYPRNWHGLSEPWRVRWLKRPACLEVAQRLGEWLPDLKPGHKFPGLFATTGSALVVSWLPDFDLAEEQKRRQVNEEHLLAVGAFTQNLLLALEAQGLGSYWASGGVLGDARCAPVLRLDPGERLTGVVFVDYGREVGGRQGVEEIEGKLRQSRDEQLGWLATWEHLPPETP